MAASDICCQCRSEEVRKRDRSWRHVARKQNKASKTINTKRDISQQVLSLMAPFLLQSTLKKAMKTTIMYDGGRINHCFSQERRSRGIGGKSRDTKKTFLSKFLAKWHHSFHAIHTTRAVYTTNMPVGVEKPLLQPARRIKVSWWCWRQSSGNGVHAGLSRFLGDS